MVTHFPPAHGLYLRMNCLANLWFLFPIGVSRKMNYSEQINNYVIHLLGMSNG